MLNKELGPNIFTEAVFEHTSVIEHLGHSKAFEQMLIDNLVERQDELSIDEVHVPRMYVPVELIESHNWPADFNVKDLKASLLSCPDKTANCGEAWTFNANYKVNGQAYSMVATEGSVKSNFYDNGGGSHEHTFEPGTGMRFMKTVAQGVLYERGFRISDKEPIILPETPDELRTLFMIVGNMKGRYDYKLHAYIPDISKPNRGLIVKHTETESPTESIINIEHAMVWKIGNGRSTEVLSHQEEVVDSAGTGLHFSVRYAQRGPTDTEPSDLPFVMNNQSAEASDKSKVVFLPLDKSLHYDIANTSIMTTIIPHLRKYLYLDQDTPSDIFNMPEELTD